jgi:hypothetical protein
MLWERCLGIGFHPSKASPTGQSCGLDLSSLRGALQRNEHFLSGPPVPGVDLDVENAPGGIFDEEVVDMANLTIG